MAFTSYVFLRGWYRNDSGLSSWGCAGHIVDGLFDTGVWSKRIEINQKRSLKEHLRLVSAQLNGQIFVR